jgi:hypothetical protein
VKIKFHLNENIEWDCMQLELNSNSIEEKWIANWCIMFSKFAWQCDAGKKKIWFVFTWKLVKYIPNWNCHPKGWLIKSKDALLDELLLFELMSLMNKPWINVWISSDDVIRRLKKILKDSSRKWSFLVLEKIITFEILKSS